MNEAPYKTPGLIELEPPLEGYMVIRTVKEAWLPIIMSTDEGKGHVGKLLDKLKAENDVVYVPSVLNARLAKMLERRGFVREIHWNEHVESYDDSVYVWRKREPIPE